jgi:hypothetical protein
MPWRGWREDPGHAMRPSPPRRRCRTIHGTPARAQLSKSKEPSVRSAPVESGWAEGADYAAHGLDDQDALNA